MIRQFILSRIHGERMTEDDAWITLRHYASKAEIQVVRSMTISVIRRTLAKVYQPRLATDDDFAMRKINAAIDVVDAERDRRELLGLDEPGPPAAASDVGRTAPGIPPWQTEPGEPSSILRNDYTDLNFIKRVVYERSVRLGDAELVKAWAWDGARFHKVISARANQFAYEELGRALVMLHANSPRTEACEAVFLTKGRGRVERFRLIIIRVGRAYENVTGYDLSIDFAPDRPGLMAFLNDWLREVRQRLHDDRV